MTATRTLILAGIAAAFLPGMSIAQDSKNQRRLVDSYGNNITTRSETSVCVRRSEWTPARVAGSCDPVAEKPEAPASKMVAATPETRSGAEVSITSRRNGNVPHKDPVQ